MNKLFSLLILCPLFLSCSPADKLSIEQAKAEITQRMDGFIADWESENAPACASIYTANAMNIAPNAPISKGRESIETFYTSLFENNLSSKYIHETVDLEIVGDQIIELGNFNVDWVSNDSTTWQFKARCMTHWKKSDNNQWMIDKFMFNNPPE